MEKQVDAHRTLWEKIRDIRYGMLTTHDPVLQALRSRPMSNQEIEFDGTLWFFISDQNASCREVAANPEVNISYADPDNMVFVSVSGSAEVVDDRARAERLWSPLYKAWFPQGLQDPHLRLLKVDVREAEYWDSPSSTMVQLYAAAKALLTGESVKEAGEHERLHNL